MRIGDVYKIGSMVKAGSSDDAIYNRFKYDYQKDEITVFLKDAKKKASSKKATKKTDPLG